MSKRMFLVMALVEWESLTMTRLPIPIGRPSPECIGALWVYENKEAAEREHPGRRVVEISTNLEVSE